MALGVFYCTRFGFACHSAVNWFSILICRCHFHSNCQFSCLLMPGLWSHQDMTLPYVVSSGAKLLSNFTQALCICCSTRLLHLNKDTGKTRMCFPRKYFRIEKCFQIFAQNATYGGKQHIITIVLTSFFESFHRFNQISLWKLFPAGKTNFQ